MHKKILFSLTIVLIAILVAGYFIFRSGTQNVQLSEENVQIVEDFLATAGEVDMAFLSSDIDNGTIIHHIYDSPKSILLSYTGEREVTQWRIIEKNSQYFIIVYCDNTTHVYKFPKAMVEQLQDKDNS